MLDCSDERRAAGPSEPDDTTLQCSASEAATHTFKVGTSGHERSVSVRRTARGTLIDIVRLQISD